MKHWHDIAMFLAMLALSAGILGLVNGEMPRGDVLTYMTIVCMGIVILRAIREGQSQ